MNQSGDALFVGAGGFGFDPLAALVYLREADPVLARLIDAVGPFGMRLNQAQSVFVALAEAIVYQQLHAKAAATIFGRVQALVPALAPDHILDTSDEALRGAGLSRAKMLALQDLARRSIAGEIPALTELDAMTDAAVIECLTRVRGIGRWTVEMLLMFRLGRPDVLPLDDLGIRKGYALAFATSDVPTRQDLERWGERWRPHRTVASWYLWRAVDLAKNAG
jgi:3-methyladenine DNA glycosylase/8-oxoguanine DNA glycosylase